MAEISGTSTSEYARLGDLLSETLDSGEDVGASVSVTVEGETVVDIWGGWADEAQTTPWGRDTITNVWSTTKTMTFLSTLVLAERGGCLVTTRRSRRTGPSLRRTARPTLRSAI